MYIYESKVVPVCSVFHFPEFTGERVYMPGWSP